MRVVPLGEVAAILNGSAFDSSLFNNDRVGLPLVRIRDVVPRNSNTYYSGAYSNDYIINNGDLLVGMDGEFNIEFWQGGKALLNQRVCKISGKQGIADTNFLKYILVPLLAKIEAETPFATVKHLSSERLKKEIIPFPLLDEQKRMARLLGKAERLQRLYSYACELSDTYLRTVFFEMFGEYFKGKVESVFSNVLDKPLQNGVFENNDNYGSGIPVIWVDNLYHTISIETENLRRVRLDDKTAKKYEVSEGDLLFTRSSLVREGVGQINIVPQLSSRTTFECHIIRARVNRNIVEPHYILGLYRSSFGRNAILKRSNTATMTTVGQEALEELPCPIPPLTLQKRFAKIVQRFEHLQYQQQEAERIAKQVFQTLMHNAFDEKPS